MTDESGGGILSSEEEDTLRKIVGDSVTLRLDRYFGLTNTCKYLFPGPGR